MQSFEGIQAITFVIFMPNRLLISRKAALTLLTAALVSTIYPFFIPVSHSLFDKEVLSSFPVKISNMLNKSGYSFCIFLPNFVILP